MRTFVRRSSPPRSRPHRSRSSPNRPPNRRDGADSPQARRSAVDRPRPVHPHPSRLMGGPQVLHRARHRHSVRLLAALAFVVAGVACGAFLASTSSAKTVAAPANPLNTKLSGVCPSTITLQIDWFPEAEYGVYFSLIGNK